MTGRWGRTMAGILETGKVSFTYRNGGIGRIPLPPAPSPQTPTTHHTHTPASPSRWRARAQIPSSTSMSPKDIFEQRLEKGFSQTDCHPPAQLRGWPWGGGRGRIYFKKKKPSQIQSTHNCSLQMPSFSLPCLPSESAVCICGNWILMSF